MSHKYARLKRKCAGCRILTHSPNGTITRCQGIKAKPEFDKTWSVACILHALGAMKDPFQPAGDRSHAQFAKTFLCSIVALSLVGGCSKAPPSMDQKAVMGDEISAGMYQRFGWELVSSHRDDENTITYLFNRPENFSQSVQEGVAEAAAEAKDKTRLADKELSEVEKTDGTK